MNTQTHLLFAAALLSHPLATARSLSKATATANSFFTDRSTSYYWAVILGASVPDLSLVIMWAQAKVRGIEESRIWSELYYSPFWQQLGAVSNSIPLFVLAALAGWWLFTQERKTAENKPWLGSAIIGFALAGLLHCITDFPLHVDDGHPHFWPISSWIFESWVSYWDRDHYGLIWIPIEVLLGIGCCIVLWRRFRKRWVRAVLLLTLLCYPIAFTYWFLSFQNS